MFINEKELEYLSRNKIFHKGVIEATDDDLNYGRVRVRVLGIHSDNKNDVPTSTLPWANICRSLDFGGLKGGVGISSIPQVGTWVYLFFDMGQYEKPVLIGSIAGVDDGSASLDPTYKTKHTIRTPANHSIEIDDGGSSVSVIHANGSKISLDDLGIHITSEGNVTVNAQSTLNVVASSSVSIQGSSITLKSDANTMVI